MRTVAWRVAQATLLGTMVGCGSDVTPILGCEPADGLTPDCRFQNPEDLAVAPAGDRLLVSQMGRMDGTIPGNLVAYTPGGAIDPLFPVGVVADDRTWGDPDCPPPDLKAFSPHGIDLVERRDGRWMLLVVNHGGRESVELFEVAARDAPDITWRGCAAGPAAAAFNDVVGTADGAFYVSHMYDADSQLGAMLKGLILGGDTGYVFAWDRAAGWRKVPGSDGPFPNGVELSADETALYINMYLAGEVRKLDLESGAVVAVSPEGGSPDNSTWASDGRLLVATHTDGFGELMSCQELTRGSCGYRFDILALDPDSLHGTSVVTHRGAPMGAATVALQMGDALYLGTFAGDRVTRMALPDGRP